MSTADQVLKERQERLAEADRQLAHAIDTYEKAVLECSPFQPGWLLDAPVQRAAYSDRTAWVMAKMAALAYESFERSENHKAKLAADLKSGGFQLLETFNNEKSSTQAFLAQKVNSQNAPEYMVLSFRGTEINCKEDIITDIRFCYQAWALEARVHGGFKNSWLSISSDITNAFDKLDDKTKTLPLYVTGHSLGGALAVLASDGLSCTNLAACYTFGSPRVGDIGLNSQRKTPLYQLINACDIVPRLPFRFVGFLHAGDVRFLDTKGRLLIGATIFNSFWQLAKSTLFTYFLERRSALLGDHSIERYITKLETIAKERNQGSPSSKNIIVGTHAGTGRWLFVILVLVIIIAFLFFRN